MDDFEYYLSTLPKNQQDTTGYKVRRFWELNGKPKDFQAAINKGMYSFNNEDQLWHAGSVAERPDGVYEWMKPANHPTAWMEYWSTYWNPEFSKKYQTTVRDGNLYYVPRTSYLQFFK